MVHTPRAPTAPVVCRTSSTHNFLELHYSSSCKSILHRFSMKRQSTITALVKLNNKIQAHYIPLQIGCAKILYKGMRENILWPLASSIIPSIHVIGKGKMPIWPYIAHSHGHIQYIATEIHLLAEPAFEGTLKRKTISLY